MCLERGALSGWVEGLVLIGLLAGGQDGVVDLEPGGNLNHPPNKYSGFCTTATCKQQTNQVTLPLHLLCLSQSSHRELRGRAGKAEVPDKCSQMCLQPNQHFKKSHQVSNQCVSQARFMGTVQWGVQQQSSHWGCWHPQGRAPVPDSACSGWPSQSCRTAPSLLRTAGPGIRGSLSRVCCKVEVLLRSC